MRTRAFKTVIACALGVAFVVAGGWYAIGLFREARIVGLTKSELKAIGQAINAYAGNISDIEHWEQISDTEQFLIPIKPLLEAGRVVYRDGWDQPYLLERRDETHAIVFTLFSNHQIRDGKLGIEITITRSDGKVTRVRNLWERD